MIPARLPRVTGSYLAVSCGRMPMRNGETEKTRQRWIAR